MLTILHAALSVALAQAPAAVPAAPVTGAPESPGMLLTLAPYLFIFAIMYFLMLRPQAKKQRDHQQFLSGLKRGDEVITASGLLGRIEGLTDQFVTLEIADGVRVKMLRAQVAVSTRAAIEAKKEK